MIEKPCFVCGSPAPVTFDAVSVFAEWSADNEIVCDWRSRFDGIRDRLRLAASDENGLVAHPACAMRWAVSEAGFLDRYPVAG